MSAIDRSSDTPGAATTPGRPRADDPRVLRTRAAVLAAARTLFLRHSYSGTTMDDIAAEAGLTKRTLYNNYDDKETLFRHMVDDTVAYAEVFATRLLEEFAADITKNNVAVHLEALGVRLALGILRPEVIAIRRMLISASRDLPEIGREYFDRAPGQVLRALTEGFATLTRRRILRVRNARYAAEQFAYLAAGAHLDRALMTSDLPAQGVIEVTARQGVATFLARYKPAS
jgi:TetR/AcrR family transcriptional regulator, mexJK operon transcriptional repressor